MRVRLPPCPPNLKEVMQIDDVVEIHHSTEVPEPDLAHVGKTGTVVDNVNDWFCIQGEGWYTWYPEESLSLVKKADYGGWQKTGKKF